MESAICKPVRVRPDDPIRNHDFIEFLGKEASLHNAVEDIGPEKDGTRDVCTSQIRTVAASKCIKSTKDAKNVIDDAFKPRSYKELLNALVGLGITNDPKKLNRLLLNTSHSGLRLLLQSKLSDQQFDDIWNTSSAHVNLRESLDVTRWFTDDPDVAGIFGTTQFQVVPNVLVN